MRLVRTEVMSADAGQTETDDTGEQSPAGNGVETIIHLLFALAPRVEFFSSSLASGSRVASRLVQEPLRTSPLRLNRAGAMHSYPEPALDLVARMTEAAVADPARAVALQGAPGCNSHRAALEHDPQCLPLPCFRSRTRSMR